MANETFSPSSVTLTDNEYTAIGKLVVAYGNLEFATEFLIWALLDIRPFSPNNGGAVTHRLQQPERRKALLTLGNTPGISDEIRCDIRKLEDKLKECSESRNALMHTLWGAQGEKSVILSRRSNYVTGHKIEPLEFSEKETLEKVAKIRRSEAQTTSIAIRVLVHNERLPPESLDGPVSLRPTIE